MTKQRRPHRFADAGQLARVSLVALLAASGSLAVAQGLKPSTQMRMPDAGAANRTPATAAPRQADYIVAVVNSDPITNNEVRTKVLRAEQQLTQRGAPLPPRAELTRQVLERMISDKAQLQMARLSGVKVDENAVDNAQTAVANQNQISVAELKSRLAADGISYARFRSDLRDEVLITRVRQREVESTVVVTEQDIDQFLRDQEGNTDLASLELNLAQVLIPVPENATPAEVSALQARAQQVSDRGRAGEDFAALVNEFSKAPEREAGGQMGLRSTDRYPTLFVDATKDLRIGGVTGPLRSGAGFHVLKVIDKKQAGMPAVSVTQTHARHILLRVTPGLTEAAAIEKLAGFKKRIAAGQADFATLARENSEDGSAKEGGDLGWVNPGTFVPEFEQVMNTLAPGQVSEPLVSRFGVHLVQVMERRQAKLSTREQRDLARNIVREKRVEEAYALWAQEVRGRAYVDYREPPN